jgi:aspartate oxidase
MKTLILVLAGALSAGTTLKSQVKDKAPQQAVKTIPAKTAEERSKKDANRAAEKLGLDELQKSKWQAASLERINANEPLKARMKASSDKSERQKTALLLKDNAKKFDETVNGFLTDDQRAKWAQVKKERKEAHMAKKKPQEPAPVTN